MISHERKSRKNKEWSITFVTGHTQTYFRKILQEKKMLELQWKII